MSDEFVSLFRHDDQLGFDHRFEFFGENVKVIITQRDVAPVVFPSEIEAFPDFASVFPKVVFIGVSKTDSVLTAEESIPHFVKNGR